MKYYAHPKKQELRMLQDDADEPGNGFKRITEENYRVLETLSSMLDAVQAAKSSPEDRIEREAKAHGFATKGVRETHNVRARMFARNDVLEADVAEGQARYDNFAKEKVSIEVGVVIELLAYIYARGDEDMGAARGVLFRAVETEAMKHKMQISEYKGGLALTVHD